MASMQNSRTYSYINEVAYKTLNTWSVAAILSNKSLYKDEYELVPIGSLLTRNKEKENIEDNKLYKQVTIRLYGKGVVQRGDELVLGKTIGTKNQFRISEGQFIMSKIDARNGAFGIVPKDLDDAITTQDFLSYNINTSKILPEFFVLITGTKHFAELCQKASSGTTGRQRVDENAFLNFAIPLPNKKVQREIIDEYNKLMSDFSNAQSSISLTKQNLQTLFETTLGISERSEKPATKRFEIVGFKSIYLWGVDKIFQNQIFASTKFDVTNLSISKGYYIEAFRGKSPKYDKDGKSIVLNQKCNRWNWIEIDFAKTVNDKWYNSIDENFFTREGDIIINSTGEGTIGRASVITKQYENLLIDSHMLLLRLNKKLLHPLFFVYLINSWFGQKQIENLKSAKSTKQTELGVQNLMKIMFPIVDMLTQKKLVAEIAKAEDTVTILEQKSSALLQSAQDYFEQNIFKD